LISQKVIEVRVVIESSEAYHVLDGW